MYQNVCFSKMFSYYCLNEMKGQIFTKWLKMSIDVGQMLQNLRSSLTFSQTNVPNVEYYSVFYLYKFFL